jgi:ATP-dependent RNA helicase RhlE
MVLADPQMERVLVFTRTKHGADKVVRNLDRAGIEAAAIHGNKSQGQRERALAAFKAGRTRVLVATDIAARGIHVDEISHVVNYELPNVPESYVHRIGRTARAGATGFAISFCNGEERAFLKAIEKLTRMNVPVAPLPAGFQAAAAAPSADDGGRREPRREERRPKPAAGHRKGGRHGQSEGRHGHGHSKSGEGRHGHAPQHERHGHGHAPRQERHGPGGRGEPGGLPSFVRDAPRREARGQA